MQHFTYPPAPHILQWLASGQLANRMQRSLRLWVLLNELYGRHSTWIEELPNPFSYPQLRDHLFAPSHGKSDHLSAEQLQATCWEPACICRKSMQEWLFNPSTEQTESQWCQTVSQLTGIDSRELHELLQQTPFATVHRSIRDDLKQLVELGWLQSASHSRYRRRLPHQWPLPPTEVPAAFSLSASQQWELLRVLESISFVQPNLELVVQSLWEQVSSVNTTPGRLETEPVQRIFIHFDYILCEEMQDRVDNYQEQLEQLWRHPPVGVIHFESWVREGCKVEVIVYPVCLHYCRRAKYLSAYGLDPKGEIAWHNYRLDRIASEQLKVLPWGDPLIPKALQKLRRSGELPAPEQVFSELEAAWGFNFYLPRELLIIRFPKAFASWYVDNTVRHNTFKPAAYSDLPKVIQECIKSRQERQQLLQLIQQRSPEDAYYRAWIRPGDINVLMRLRDWRPNGEVIAPLSIRRQLAEEAERELSNYRPL